MRKFAVVTDSASDINQEAARRPLPPPHILCAAPRRRPSEGRPAPTGYNNAWKARTIL